MGWLLKHGISQAHHLHQPVQPFGGNKIQLRLLACATRHRGLGQSQQRFKISRLQVQVLAQGCQPGAAPALLNCSQALLFIESAELSGPLPEGLAQVRLLVGLGRWGQCSRSHERSGLATSFDTNLAPFDRALEDALAV
ncbi:MAG: hypothetical protein EBZ29_09690 [Synechococcaceae bacterium WB9_4xC_028]|nr:hypothetical protein [Synechococcaceae bacterium WB9_4xC_028]